MANALKSMCLSMLLIHIVGTCCSLNRLHQADVEENPGHLQGGYTSAAVLSPTPHRSTHDADHGRKLHHHSYQTHPHTTLSDIVLGICQARGASSTVKVVSRGGQL